MFQTAVEEEKQSVSTGLTRWPPALSVNTIPQTDTTEQGYSITLVIRFAGETVSLGKEKIVRSLNRTFQHADTSPSMFAHAHSALDNVGHTLHPSVHP